MPLAALAALIGAGVDLAIELLKRNQEFEAIRTRMAAEGRTVLTPAEVATIRAKTDELAPKASAILRGELPPAG